VANEVLLQARAQRVARLQLCREVSARHPLGEGKRASEDYGEGVVRCGGCKRGCIEGRVGRVSGAHRDVECSRGVASSRASAGGCVVVDFEADGRTGSDVVVTLFMW
jgi:hypothetical protein